MTGPTAINVVAARLCAQLRVRLMAVFVGGVVERGPSRRKLLPHLCIER